MTGRLLPTAVSPVLREAVTLKSEELAHAKAAFGDRYDGSSTENDIEPAGNDTLKRLSGLLERIKKLDPYLTRDDDLPILTRYVEQAQDDRSMSEAKLLRLERDLKDKLDKHASRLEVSSLHVELLVEALDKGDGTASLAAKLESTPLEDEFEMVEGGLEDVLDKFEKHTFTAKDVDTKAIEEYLAKLFENDAANKQLKRVRRDLETYGEDVMTGSEEVDEDVLMWCIADLLKNDLVSDEKKKTLQGYLQSPLVLRELTGTLNMKSVRHWHWRNAEKGLPVTARQNSEGKYCITVEEDVIDMLFLHSLAVGWSMKLRECLTDAITFKGLWPGNTLLTPAEIEKREYYLLPPRPKLPQSCSMCHGPPPPPMQSMPCMPPPPVVEYPRPSRRRDAPMPPPPPPPPPIYGKGKIKSNGYTCPPAPPPPGTPNLNDERYRNYTRDFFLSRLPKRDGCSPESVSPEQTQAVLLKTLATELTLRETLDGSVYGLTANFEAFASSLPHQTILTVLKFLGVSDRWLAFFTHFLSAPLNMGPIVRGTSDQILTRTRGMPIAHGLETFFSEAILFFLDLTVHQKTNAYLYRLRDNCYFVGNEQQRNDTVHELDKFAHVMGFTVNTKAYLDTEPIAFLVPSGTGDAPSNSVSFSIDSAKVEVYARRVKNQLAACNTVLEWIRTWNTTIGIYATHLFGPLANVFGKAHLEAVTKAHNLMHSIIFEDGNLTSHVKNLLTTHLKRPLTDPPFALEALIHLPLAYGGLGVKNPYITLNLARSLLDTPSAELTAYLEAEKKYYDCALEAFTRLTPAQQSEKLTSIFNDDKARMATVFGPDTDPPKFPARDVFTSNRERAAYPFLLFLNFPPAPGLNPPDLIPAYNTLLTEPIDHIATSDKIADEVARLSGKLEMKRLYRLSGEERWTLQLYGDECFERYGGLEVWHGESVPRDVLRLVRGEVEDQGDDGSSTGSLDSVC